MNCFPFKEIIQIIKVLQVLTVFYFLTLLTDGEMLAFQKYVTMHISKIHQTVIYFGGSSKDFIFVI